MTETSSKMTVSRRRFVQGSFATAAAVGSGAALFGCQKPDVENPPVVDEPVKNETIHWTQCNVNCGGNCFFKWHSVDGKVQYMESDNTGNTDLQSRACLRGRSMRRWLNHEQRLLYPMKRVGKRGEGKFQQITWEEAIKTIGDKLKYTYENYGPNAVYVIYATGMYSATGKAGNRLLSLLGGYLNQGLDYSTHMMTAVMPYMFGTQYSPYDNVHASSFSEAANNSDMVVMFGNSPAETRMGGANAVWDFVKVREAVVGRGGKVVHIDYRLNETASGHPEEWLPIRPGTDSALVAAIAHEWIVNGQIDKAFLDTYCVGYDDDTMPASAKGRGKSYKDYVMGTGADRTEKTPEWASVITMIPADKIRALAADIASARAPFIVQGWGPQRHTNGEETARAISVLPCLIGKIGLPGTNTGQREAEPPIYLVGSINTIANPNPTVLPVYQWLNAVDHGETMTATNAGIKGAEELGTKIKFIWNYAGNCITNQHGDINKVHEILQDETKCEFILGWDTVMTDSAMYADILLPDAMRSEQMNLQTQGYSEYWTAVGLGTAAQEAPGECRSSYDVCADIAEYLGVKDAYTEGRTHDEWIKHIYETNYGEAYGITMPDYETMKEQGIFKMACAPSIGLKAFRDDPVANPLGTPSGKIEIYSEQLEQLNSTWELPAGEKIYALPEFHPGFEGYGCTTEQFPLYGTGFHHKSRTHSSFGFIEELEQVARQRAWINTATAAQYGISNGDTITVSSPVGTIKIEAYVTSRIVPGTVAIPQGSWHQANMFGDKVDTGGCVNTLTAYHPSPLAKGNGTAHTFICQIAKA